MPTRPKTYRPPGSSLTTRPAPDRHAVYNRDRRDPTLLKLYGTERWKKFRSMIRTARVLCERCKTRDLVVPGRDVHHKVDPRENIDLAFDPGNVELLCKSCHSRETAQSHK